jgi:hypothetical protein
VPIGDLGTVYPTMTLQDDWGTLLVESGGVFLRKKPNVATVSVTGFDPHTLHGNGFTLTLKSGWTIQPGPRKGDLEVTPPGKSTKGQQRYQPERTVAVSMESSLTPSVNLCLFPLSLYAVHSTQHAQGCHHLQAAKARA